MKAWLLAAIASPHFRSWLVAFLVTQAVEVPIWQWALRPRPLQQRLAIGFGASLITHPLLWICWPLGFSGSYWVATAFGETGVVIVEAIYIHLWSVRSPVVWSLLANGASFASGLVLGYFFGWF